MLGVEGSGFNVDSWVIKYDISSSDDVHYFITPNTQGGQGGQVWCVVIFTSMDAV